MGGAAISGSFFAVRVNILNQVVVTGASLDEAFCVADLDGHSAAFHFDPVYYDA